MWGVRIDVAAFFAIHAGIAVFQAIAATFQARLYKDSQLVEHSLWGHVWWVMACGHLMYGLTAVLSVQPGTLIMSTPWLPGTGVLCGHVAAGILLTSYREMVGRPLGRTAKLGLLASATLVTYVSGWGATGDAAQVQRYVCQLAGGSLACLAAGPALWRLEHKPGRRFSKVLGVSLVAYAVPLGLAAWVLQPWFGAPSEELMPRMVVIGCLDFAIVSILGLSLVQGVLDRSRQIAADRLHFEQAANEERERQSTHFRALVEWIPASLFTIDTRGRCSNELQPERAIFGISRDGCNALTVEQLVESHVHPQDRSLAKGLFSPSESIVLDPRLEDLRIAPAAEPVENYQTYACVVRKTPDNSLLLVAATNVTEQRSLQTRTGQAERLESVGRLAAGVAHDFNNLLTIVHNGVSSLMHGAKPSPPQLEILGDIRLAAQRGATLTRQLLAFASGEPLALEQVEVGLLVGQLVPMLRQLLPDSVRVHFVHAREPLCVLADPGKLERVLVNLVTNSRDAMPDGGELFVSVAAIADEEVELAVRDTGAGMDADVLSKARVPFFTTKPVGKGNGLGLATSSELASQLAGRLLIESTPNQGTRVAVVLPRILSAESEQQARLPPKNQPGLAGRTVLVVEDEPTVRRALVRILSHAGYRVVESADGVAALDQLELRDDVACIVTDFAMPRMSGDRLAQEAWDKGYLVPVLFVSAFADAFALAGSPIVPTAFLPKPYSAQRLLQLVEELLSRAGPRASL